MAPWIFAFMLVPGSYGKGEAQWAAAFPLCLQKEGRLERIVSRLVPGRFSCSLSQLLVLMVPKGLERIQVLLLLGRKEMQHS